MSTSPIHPSSLIVGKHYDSISEVAGVKIRKYLGIFVGLEVVGRPYDPDAVLSFRIPPQNTYSFTWNMRDEFYETQAVG